MKLDPRKERRKSRYQTQRRIFLTKYPLCAECYRQGRTEAAAELDHIIPVDRAPDKFWDKKNWQGLCRPCHEAKTARENMVTPRTLEQLEWDKHVSRHD